MNSDLIRTIVDDDDDKVEHEYEDYTDSEGSFDLDESGKDFLSNITTGVKSFNDNLMALRSKAKVIQDASIGGQGSNQTTLQQKINKLLNKRKRNQPEDGDDVEEQQLEEEEDDNTMLEEDTKLKKNAKKTIETINFKKGKDTSFAKLGLIKPLLKAVEDLSYIKPTPVQEMSFNAILSGKDVLASSVTGTGKTAAFLLPLLQRYFTGRGSDARTHSKVVVVTPTRELALQCMEMFQELNKYTRLSVSLVIGAIPLAKQEAELRSNPEFIIATPGRLIDHIKNSRSVSLEDVEVIIFDEADKLLELGFSAEVKEIIKNTNPQRQTILFSATLSSELNQIIDLALKKPIRLKADPDNKTAEHLRQEIVRLPHGEQENERNQMKTREAVLLALVTKVFKHKVIIFFKTKSQCHRMAIIFGLLGLKACELHGNLSQSARIAALDGFKENQYDYLLATDLASRGIDIKEVKAVINFEVPTEIRRYVHRVGRTARAGESGVSLTICNDYERKTLKSMLKKFKEQLFIRTYNEELVSKYKGRIWELETEIDKIRQEERVEREIRKAEMEVNKVQNMMTYQDEIYNRPKREWIVNKKEKHQIRVKSKNDANDIKKKKDGLKLKNKKPRTRKERRKEMMKKRILQAQREERRNQEGGY